MNLEIAQIGLVPFRENFKQSPARNFYIGVRDVVSKSNVCPVAGLTLDEAAAFLAGVRARRAADRR